MACSEAQASVPGASNKSGERVIDWVIEYAIFLHGLAQQWKLRKKRNLAQSSLGDEDDARTLNARTAQRKRATPHSTMKNNRNMTSVLACSSDLGDD